MRTVTHPEHQKDYNAGWDDACEFIRAAGIGAASSRWNAENPRGQNPSTLGAYYYACGGLDAIVAASA
jgi:hypothetical protein